MRKKIKTLLLLLMVGLTCGSIFVGCGGGNCDKYLKIEPYTNSELGYEVNNDGVTFKCIGDNTYEIGGTVPVASETVLSGFNFQENETHIVSLKLSANTDVDKDTFSLEVKGPNKTNTFDKSALDGDDYTYLLLSVDGMTEDKGYTITVKWNRDDEATIYTIKSADNLKLAEANA